MILRCIAVAKSRTRKNGIYRKQLLIQLMNTKQCSYHAQVISGWRFPVTNHLPWSNERLGPICLWRAQNESLLILRSLLHLIRALFEPYCWWLVTPASGVCHRTALKSYNFRWWRFVSQYACAFIHTNPNMSSNPAMLNVLTQCHTIFLTLIPQTVWLSL